MPDRSSSMAGRAPALLVFALVAVVGAGATAACGGRGAGTSAPVGSGAPPSDRALVQTQDAPAGLELRVSSGRAGPPAFDRARLAPARPLPDAEASALLSRMKPIATEPGDPQAFALRAGSQPPPRTGQTIQAAFPPPASSLLPPPAVSAGRDLRVLRYMPEGSVPLAPELSVTFSQPMVAVTSQADAAAVAPVKLTPQPAGQLALDRHPHDRVPPRRPVPAGDDLHRRGPGGDGERDRGRARPAGQVHVRDPGAGADRRITRRARRSTSTRRCSCCSIRRSIRPRCWPGSRVKAAGQARALRRLDAAEIAPRPRSSRRSSTAPGAASRTAAGSRSARPSRCRPTPRSRSRSPPARRRRRARARPARRRRSSSRPIRRSGSTRSECGWSGECRPGMPFQIEFNNPLDADQVRRRPARDLAGDPRASSSIASGRVVSVIGVTAARTRYRRRGVARRGRRVRPGARQGRAADVQRRRRRADVLRRRWPGRARSGARPGRRSTSSAPTTTSSRSSSTRSPRRTSTPTASRCATGGTTTTRRSCPAARCSISWSPPAAARTSSPRPTSICGRRSARAGSATRSRWSSRRRGRPRTARRRGWSSWVQSTRLGDRRPRRQRQPGRLRERARHRQGRRRRRARAPPYGIAGTTDDARPRDARARRRPAQGRELPGRAQGRRRRVRRRGRRVLERVRRLVPPGARQAARLVRHRRSQAVQARRGGLAQGLAAHDRSGQERRRRRAGRRGDRRRRTR